MRPFCLKCTEEVSEEEGQELARRLELSIFKETSAKTGKNIQEVFKAVRSPLGWNPVLSLPTF